MLYRCVCITEQTVCFVRRSPSPFLYTRLSRLGIVARRRPEFPSPLVSCIIADIVLCVRAALSERSVCESGCGWAVA